MLRLGYLVFMWVAVWKESDMQLISEQSHWQTQTKARRAVAPSYFVSTKESPPPGLSQLFQFISNLNIPRF